MIRGAQLARDVLFLKENLKNPGKIAEEVNVSLFVRELVLNFSCTDPELRDELSYGLVARLILGGYLPPEEHLALLDTALDNQHLFYGIGERNTDTVFVRSFSVLLIPLLFANEQTAPKLYYKQIQSITDSLLLYASLEQDWRGYIPGKGWAHAVAHTADALLVCGIHPAIDESLAIRILNGIRQLAMITHPLAYLEDDRLAYAAFSIIERGTASVLAVENWLYSFQLAHDQDNDGDETVCGANAEHFLRSLYFRFFTRDRNSLWLEKVVNALSRFDIYQLNS